MARRRTCSPGSQGPRLATASRAAHGPCWPERLAQKQRGERNRHTGGVVRLPCDPQTESTRVRCCWAGSSAERPRQRAGAAMTAASRSPAEAWERSAHCSPGTKAGTTRGPGPLGAWPGPVPEGPATPPAPHAAQPRALPGTHLAQYRKWSRQSTRAVWPASVWVAVSSRRVRLLWKYCRRLLTQQSDRPGPCGLRGA